MRTTTKISISLLFMMGMSACDSYLDKNPDNRVELDTPKKAAQLLTSAYSSAAYTFTEWMGDNVTYTMGTTILPEHLQAYEWREITSIEQDTPGNFWSSTYEAIAAANEVLAVIDDLPGDRNMKKAVKGEAYLTRAYGHFMLASIFCKHYNEATADEDPGIPYVTEPERQFVKKYERGTLEDTFDKIEDDLEEGLDLVDGTYYANSGKYHFTRDAALAFASRFYLFKGDYDNCIAYSSELLGNDPNIFMKDIQALLDETPNADAFLKAYGAPTDRSNLLVIRQVTNFPVTVGFWPDNQILSNLFQSNPWNRDDVRTALGYPIYIRGTNGLTLAKYEFLFERTSLTSNVGLYYTIAPVFRGEEVLLNRAESYARKNQFTQAIADLQVFVKTRYNNPVVSLNALKNYYGVNNNLAVTLAYIVEERQKEFIHEGLRWFDIKRFDLSVDHYRPQGTIILSANDLRKIIQIPQSAIDIAGLEPNPR